MDSWQKYGRRLRFGFLFGNYIDNMQPINIIKDYYGEKVAFYYAWLMHYTGFLIPLSIFGVIFFVIVAVRRSQIDDVQEIMNTPYSLIFTIVVMVWSTLYIESWKRT